MGGVVGVNLRLLPGVSKALLLSLLALGQPRSISRFGTIQRLAEGLLDYYFTLPA